MVDRRVVGRAVLGVRVLVVVIVFVAEVALQVAIGVHLIGVEQERTVVGRIEHVIVVIVFVDAVREAVGVGVVEAFVDLVVAVVVRVVAELRRPGVDQGIQEDAVRCVRVAVAVGVVVAEVQLAVSIVVCVSEPLGLAHDHRDEELEVHIVDAAVAVQVRDALRHQAEAVGVIRVGVRAGRRVCRPDGHRGRETGGHADLEGSESAPAGRSFAIGCGALGVGLAEVLDCGLGDARLGVEQDLALDVQHIHRAVAVEIPARRRVGHRGAEPPREERSQDCEADDQDEGPVGKRRHPDSPCSTTMTRTFPFRYRVSGAQPAGSRGPRFIGVPICPARRGCRPSGGAPHMLEYPDRDTELAEAI